MCRYGLIRDAPLFEWLEANVHRLLARDSEAIAYAVERSCINKVKAVGSLSCRFLPRLCLQFMRCSRVVRTCNVWLLPEVRLSATLLTCPCRQWHLHLRSGGALCSLAASWVMRCR